MKELDLGNSDFKSIIENNRAVRQPMHRHT